jgi:hypothetical protein
MLRRSPHWWSPITSYMYGFNLVRMILDKMKLIAVTSHDNCATTLFVDWLNNTLLPLIRQFFLNPNRINDFVNRNNVSPLAWISSAGIWSLSGNLHFFSFTIAIVHSASSVQLKYYLEVNSSGSGLESWDYSRRYPSHWQLGTFYPQRLALTSLTSGGRSRTQATEFGLVQKDGTTH